MANGLNCLEPPAVTGHSVRQPVVTPLGDTKDAYEILTDLAERLGFRDDWNDLLNVVCGFWMKPQYLLEPEKRYSADELYDRLVVRPVFALADFGGAPTAVLFWSTWSPRSAEMLADFARYREAGSLRLLLVAEYRGGRVRGTDLGSALRGHDLGGHVVRHVAYDLDDASKERLANLLAPWITRWSTREGPDA